jgi:cellulose synthase/poly-beta-1,6-N-acetylglucosamine synthase-like glycosyltransferase
VRTQTPLYSARPIAIPDRQTRSVTRQASFPQRRVIIKKRHETLALPLSTQTAIQATPLAQLPAPVVVKLLAATTIPVVKQLALLLPAHNEELIIEATIRSAIAAGQAIEDIYVVNDNSSDATESIALRLLGKDQVLTVERSGKALAVKKAITKFAIESRYTWLHIADADSIFSQDYFRHYCSKLDPGKYAVAVGFVQSLRGNWISTYRALTYTYSQQVTRRIQSRLGMISVFPGPITCFRTDIIKDLEFGGASLTEDFDITLQVHRKKLGRILFIPQAVNYTQDPQTLTDFCKQNLRWQRGFFQGVKKYKIGLRGQRIDISLGFQMLQTILFLLQLFVLIPIILITTQNWLVIPVMIAADIIVNGFIALASSVAVKRWSLIGALPYFYFLRWLEIGIYIIAFVEVIILKRFQTEIIGWSTAGRRYELSKQAMIDVAK